MPGLRPGGGLPADHLWTNGALHAARRIYQRAGFTLDDEATREAFGGLQVEQNWSREL